MEIPIATPVISDEAVIRKLKEEYLYLKFELGKDGSCIDLVRLEQLIDYFQKKVKKAKEDREARRVPKPIY